MEFPLIFFLYVYFVFLAVWGVLFFVALYHMFRFSFKNVTSFMIVAVFAGVASLMLEASFEFIKGIDWQAPVMIFENLPKIKLPF